MGSEMTCHFCHDTATARDHTACAFIAELAEARGTSFARAAQQYAEDNLVDVVEARVLGDEVLEPAAATPMFVVGDE